MSLRQFCGHRFDRITAQTTRSNKRALAAVIAALLCLAAGKAVAEDAARWRRQQWLIPSPEAKVEMRTAALLPSGRGPFPLAVINHGTTENEEERAQYPAPQFDVVASWLIAHGYAVVLPQRPGHGETGGPYLESTGSCDHARYAEAGYGAADSIQTAIDYALRQPIAKQERVLVVGNSAGAWGALALASRGANSIAGVINFSGGLGGHSYGDANRNCAPDRLIDAAATYGRTAKAPTLWFYSANDSYFGPDLSERMADAFRSAGGRVDYRLLPPVGNEGHALIYSRAAVRLWGPIVEKFLTTLRQ